MNTVEKITSLKVLREDGNNHAWVNGRYIGTVSEAYVSWLNIACPIESEQQYDNAATAPTGE